MSIQKSSSHSFIVKIWAEEFFPARQQMLWRGHITHVGSGERQYLQSLEKVAQFIAPYLQTMSAKSEETE